MFEWFELRDFFDMPNYFWILCGLALLLLITIICFSIALGKKSAKIKTLHSVLAEEKCKCGDNCACDCGKTCECGESCSCDSKEHEEDMGDKNGLATENETLSKELSSAREMLQVSQVTCDSLKEENESLKKRIVELEEDVEVKETKCAELEAKHKEITAHLEALKAKNVENTAEIASYKATNDILSKSIDNLKVQLADARDEIDSLKLKLATLSDVEKKAAEEAESNKVLMKAVSLIMKEKEPTESTSVILHEQEEVKIPVAAKPVKKQAKVRAKKAPAAKPVETELESMKRPDLMHLAKREGVQRFARKSNEEIIRLIKENRKKSK